jgi:hypothetical protein
LTGSLRFAEVGVEGVSEEDELVVGREAVELVVDDAVIEVVLRMTLMMISTPCHWHHRRGYLRQPSPSGGLTTVVVVDAEGWKEAGNKGTPFVSIACPTSTESLNPSSSDCHFLNPNFERTSASDTAVQIFPHMRKCC